ncbi:MAG: cupin domain-containing protein, partial [Deltaproteobacteria bacterium]|nr:cupin domain-containing protein [Deltaproteobacteria bacterium]
TSDDSIASEQGSPWYYKWRETEQSLKKMLNRPAGTDLVMEYKGKNNGPTMPTLLCGQHMLRPGEVTKTRRRTSCGIFHVMRGQGKTVVGDTVMNWEQGDYFVIPNWSWHHFENQSAKEEAILFFMSDRPMFEPFGLYREEFQG